MSLRGLALSIARRLCFFCNDTATTEIYTLSLHDALPIWTRPRRGVGSSDPRGARERMTNHSNHAPHDKLGEAMHAPRARKSTRLNSRHANISYAVFCLKKKTWHDNDRSLDSRFPTLVDHG